MGNELDLQGRGGIRVWGRIQLAECESLRLGAHSGGLHTTERDLRWNQGSGDASSLLGVSHWDPVHTWR